MINTQNLLTLLISFAISGMSMATSYQLQPVYLYEAEAAQSANALGANFNVSFPHAEWGGAAKHTGHYGFGLSVTRLMPVNNTHWLGIGLTFNSNTPSSFVQERNQLSTVSLYDLNVLSQYQYAVSDAFSMGVSAGLGFIYGWASGAESHFYSRFAPVIGFEALWQVANGIALSIGYQHHFGVAANKAYQTRQGAPSIDRIAFGVRYVF